MYWYGGGPADWAMALVTVGGTERIPQMQPGAIITCHNDQVAGTQYTDLVLADGTAVTQIVASPGDTVYGPGTLPRFRAPVLSMWFSINGGPRMFVVSTDVPDIMQQLSVAAQAAQQAAEAAATDAAAVAESSSIAGHLAEADPHPQYLNDPRGDLRYVRADAGTVAPLDEPRETLTFASTPAAESANMSEVWITHEGVTRLAAWDNERNNPRREQLPGASWDHLFGAITAYNGTGRAVNVDIRGSDNVRRQAGGIDALGRPVTSDQTWTPITNLDPDSTGAYTASTAIGPAPLGVRWETDDTVRMQGRIDATAVTAGHTLAVLPAGYLPLSQRLLTLPTTNGQTVTTDLFTNGRIVAQTTLAGPVTLALDDLTFARVTAPQPTGNWTITSAAIATPGTNSPLSLTHAGATDRLYVLILARSSAADPFTTVTDNASNTWTRITYAPTSGTVGRRIEMWTCQPTTVFASVSVGFTGAGTAYASLYEITGHHTTTPLDQAASDHRSFTTAPAAVEIIPSGTGRLVIAAITSAPNNLAQITSSPGWTALPSNNGGPAVVYQTDPAASAPLGVSWTLATSAGSGHAIAAIAPA